MSDKTPRMSAEEWDALVAAIQADEGRRSITIDLPARLHRELGIERAETGAYQREVVIEGVMAELRRRRTGSK